MSAGSQFKCLAVFFYVSTCLNSLLICFPCHHIYSCATCNLHHPHTTFRSLINVELPWPNRWENETGERCVSADALLRQRSQCNLLVSHGKLLLICTAADVGTQKYTSMPPGKN